MAGSSEVRTLMCRHKASLLRELNATNLLNVLVKRGVISEVDRDAVAGSADRSSETDIDLFIDVIGTKGFNAFREFCFALEAECPHVLTNLLVDHHGVNGKFLLFTDPYEGKVKIFNIFLRNFVFDSTLFRVILFVMG